MSENSFKNPFRPGAGHMPPYLAGRESETQEFLRLLDQERILENMILTGLRGVGKTVLLDTFKPLAIEKGWLWAGTDLSESATVTEDSMALRLLTDLAVVTSNILIKVEEQTKIGFNPEVDQIKHTMTYRVLVSIFESTPGLVADKLKAVFETVWDVLCSHNRRGLVFAYDEAQNLSDQAAKDQYPLSTLLDVFQSVQKKGIPFMLILTGLPTLFPKLVEARTFSERMFHVIFLDRLNKADSQDAILKPIEDADCPLKLSNNSAQTIIEISGGYPYFIQFICREVYDVFIQQHDTGREPSVPIDEIVRKLDTDFFAGRWSKATDRQRELLSVIARLPNADAEFTVQEVVALSKDVLEKSFGSSHVNQMLASLSDAGLVYKNRHGRYSFAVPLLAGFILRQIEERN